MDPDISKSIRQQVQAAVSSSQHSLLSEMKTLLDSKLGHFEEKINDTQKELAVQQISRLDSMADNYKFQKKGCEEQYKFNSKVAAKLSCASASLNKDEKTSDDLSRAHGSIEEGMELIKQRQKLIKIADSSEHGWKVVDEYVSNPLADDSDDEKKLFRAINRASRKVKTIRNKKRNEFRFTPYRKPDLQTTTPSTSTLQTASKPKPGRCFACGVSGHWRADCRAVAQDNTDKISIFSITPSIDVYNGHFLGHHDIDRSDQHTQSYPVGLFDNDVCKQSVKQSNNLDISPCLLRTSESPVGRLRQNFSLWQAVTSNEHVLDIIKNGYKLPFKTMPARGILCNNKSALDNRTFVTSEIQKLLDLGCIVQENEQPFVVNPLTVAFNKSGKSRLVLDCRSINLHLFKFKHKYEDASAARQLFGRGDFLFTFDLKSAYHHISVAPADSKFLGFSWCDNGVTKFFTFQVLPFGLSTSGYIFTKVLREVIKWWRGKGIKVIMFLDDGLGGDSDIAKASHVSSSIRLDLCRFGFLLAHAKCDWEPKRVVTWLGLQWDTALCKISLTRARADSLYTSVESALKKIENGKVLFKALYLAAIVGKIISAQIVFGDLVRFFTRSMYYCLTARASWEAPVIVTEDAINEMVFWKENCYQLNDMGVRLDLQFSPGESDVCAWSDASGSGYGGFISNAGTTSLINTVSSLDDNSFVRNVECADREHSFRDGAPGHFVSERHLTSAHGVSGSGAPRKVTDLGEYTTGDPLHDCGFFLGLGLAERLTEVVQSVGSPCTSAITDLIHSMSKRLLHSKSDNTVRTYYFNFKKWLFFASSHTFVPLPAQPIHVALYLTHLLDHGASYHSINAAIYSIKWAHELSGFSIPTDNVFVANLQESAKRTVYKPVHRKDPVTAEMLINLCDMFIYSNDFFDVRDLTMLLLAFAGFLRFDELVSLRRQDVVIHDNYLKLHISHSKTDKYRQGDEVLVAKGHSSACPYHMFVRFLGFCDLSEDSSFFLFRAGVRSHGVGKSRSVNKKLSYTTVRERLVGKLRLVGGGLNFGLHSLRSGSATAAANANVNERCWKRHGRGASDCSKDMYVVDDVSKRLSVSQHLGL